MENDQKPSRVWANRVQNVKKFQIQQNGSDRKL